MRNVLTVCLVLLISGCGGEGDGSSVSPEKAPGEKPSTQKTSGQKNPGQNVLSPGPNSNTGSPQAAMPAVRSNRVRQTTLLNVNDLQKDRVTLRRAALAAFNFHDVLKRLPMAPIKNGNKAVSEQLSWRVRILPFLEKYQLYEKFNPSEPWDSAQNKPLILAAEMDFTLSNGNLVCAIQHDVQPKSFRNIFDGTSNTIMLLENPNVDGNSWTQPVDLKKEDAVKLVKSLKKGEYLVGVFYDGSSVTIYSPAGKNLTDAEIAAPFGYNDGTPNNSALFESPN